MSIIGPPEAADIETNKVTVVEQETRFPTDFQYLSNANRKLIRDEVIGYVQSQIIDREDRSEIVGLYDTFKIEATSRKTLRELTVSFLDS